MVSFTVHVYFFICLEMGIHYSKILAPPLPTLRQIRTRLALKYLRRPTSQSYEAPRSRNFQRAASRYLRGVPPCRVQMVAEEARHCSRRRS